MEYFIVITVVVILLVCCLDVKEIDSDDENF